MNEILIGIFAALAVVGVGLLLLLVLREIIRRIVRDEFEQTRAETTTSAHQLREEVHGGLKTTTDSLVNTISSMSSDQKQQIENLRHTLDGRMKQLEDTSERRLEKIRETVQEKLEGTLEKRLGDSFKLVSERLEAVQRGLGEMQNLATGVGDLKRVLTNVKARGTWGEIQLGSLLEQMLTPEQYGRNVQTRDDARTMVEFAVKLPGREPGPENQVWLPIDSKFPQEDYLRLVDAAERGEAEEVLQATNALNRAVQKCAQEIREKYVNPPATTDFAILFLPTEGLYAEVLRQPGLVEELQHKHRVVVAGPTTLSALLNSLRMGFQTLAIEQRTSEIWGILAAVKTEFGKFGGVLEKLKKQLQTASRTIDETGVRTRAMERKLRQVEELPADSSASLLELDMLEPDDPPADEPPAEDTR